MKSVLAIAILFVCSHVWAAGPEECQDKLKDDMQLFYDNVNKGSKIPHTFKILEPTEFHFPKDDAIEAVKKKASENSAAESEDDDYIVTTHAIARYKSPPDMEFSIKYEIHGKDCIEINNSRQMLNINQRK